MAERDFSECNAYGKGCQNFEKCISTAQLEGDLRHIEEGLQAEAEQTTDSLMGYIKMCFRKGCIAAQDLELLLQNFRNNGFKRSQ